MPIIIKGARASTRRPTLISEEEAARLIGITPGKLRRLGYEKRGPKFLRIGHQHLFREQDVADWIASQIP